MARGRESERRSGETVSQVYQKERELQQEIEQAVAVGEPGVEVLAVELSGPERFCVYIDRSEGVDLALCERVSMMLRDYADRYTVDVSSPGLARPLRTRDHFELARGRQVVVRTAREIGGRRRFKGVVAVAHPNAVELEVADGRVEIPYAEIVRSNLIDEGRET